MKGISAMIATVLLIAFTVAIGGVMSIWLTGLTSTQQQQVSNQSSAQVKCVPSLTIDRVDSGIATSAYIMNITLSNPSQQTVAPVNVTIILTNASVFIPVNITSLAPGASYFGSIGNWSALPSMVRVNGLCSGLPVSFTCKPTDSCWRAA
ncbi:MAG: hypothetical protein V1944_00060 [Candidatus Aenigmatarchaeota archaeon]